jgi:hypothetical protein
MWNGAVRARLRLSRLLKKAAGTSKDRPGGLSHNTTSTVCRRSGTGFLACRGLFQQPARLGAISDRSLQFIGLTLRPQHLTEISCGRLTLITPDLEFAGRLCSREQEARRDREYGRRSSHNR